MNEAAHPMSESATKSGLRAALDAAEADQAAADAAVQGAFDSFAAQTVAATAAATGASLAEFGAAADAEEAGFCVPKTQQSPCSGISFL